jgi:hypothetical protein
MGKNGRQAAGAFAGISEDVMMFQWLEQEIKTIRTGEFHVVDGPASDSLRAITEGSGGRLPKSYEQFVLRFGNAKLYRKHGYYIVGVPASPRLECYSDGVEFYRVGHYQSSDAYVRAALRGDGEESPVFEGVEGQLVQVADGFETWVSRRCRDARSTYGKRQWAAIVAGPTPFTGDEVGIVEARRFFSCRIVGVSPRGNALFEVHNGSQTRLPFLSVGVRRRGSGLDGGAWLPVGHVQPGQTAVIEHHAYGPVVDPRDVEIFQLPDPRPHNRDRYWEFRSKSMTVG